MTSWITSSVDSMPIVSHAQPALQTVNQAHARYIAPTAWFTCFVCKGHSLVLRDTVLLHTRFVNWLILTCCVLLCSWRRPALGSTVVVEMPGLLAPPACIPCLAVLCLKNLSVWWLSGAGWTSILIQQVSTARSCDLWSKFNLQQTILVAN
jgi:hypothetical protein